MAPTMKHWTLKGTENDFDELVFGSGPVPRVGEHEVLVKLHAAALNYRDLIIPKVCLADLTNVLIYLLTLMSRDCIPSRSSSPSSPAPTVPVKSSRSAPR